MDVGKYLMDRSVRKGECWIWQQCLSVSGGIPVATIGGKRAVRVRRWALEERSGKKLGERKAMATCGTALCVNPRHLEAMTPKAIAVWLAEHGRMSTEAHRLAKSIKARARSPLTAENVAEIRRRRADGELCKALAAEFGVTPPTISKIARNVNWRDVTHVASVFSWRPV